MSQAQTRLKEAVSHEVESDDSLVLDASIQRFEFTFEMSWKTIKRFLDFKGLSAKTPRDCFKSALKLGWIKDDDLWVMMIEDRNKTSHTYNRKIANEVHSHLKNYVIAFDFLIAELKKQY